MAVAAQHEPGHQRLEHDRIEGGRVTGAGRGRRRQGGGAGRERARQRHRQQRARRGGVTLRADVSGLDPAQHLVAGAERRDRVAARAEVEDREDQRPWVRRQGQRRGPSRAERGVAGAAEQRLVGPHGGRHRDHGVARQRAGLTLDGERALASHDVGGACGPRDGGVLVEGDHRQQPVDRRLRPGVVVDLARAGDPVVGHPGGGVVHRLTGRVGAEVPSGHDPGEAERSIPAARVRRREQRLQARVGAVRDLRGVAPGRHPAVVGPARGQQPGVERERVAHRALAQLAVTQRHRGAGQPGRRQAAPPVPHRAGQRPGADRSHRPGPGVATAELGDALAEPSQRGARGRRAAGADVRREPQDSLGRGVRPVGDEPGRRFLAVDVEVLAVLVEDLPVHGSDGELEPVAQEARERRVGAAEGGVALAERPDGAGQPVGRVAVGRVGLLGGLGTRVQGAVGLHPQDDVAGVGAGRGLQVGQAAQQVVRRLPARGRAGGPPVAQVDDRGPADVVGVERPLPPRVGRRVVDAAAHVPEAAVGVGLGVGPQHADRGLVREPVGRVVSLGRGSHRDRQPVEVGQVGEAALLVLLLLTGRWRRRGRGRRRRAERGERQGQQHGGRQGDSVPEAANGVGHVAPRCCGDGGHPLTPDPRSEAVKCLWKAMNRATAGAASTTAPARIDPNGLAARPAITLM